MLVMDLGCTNPHYFCCIKPNSSKAYGVFESGEVVRQLQYSGMMKTVRLCQEGSSNQEDHGSNNSTFVFQWKTPTQNGKGIENLVQVL
jgi:myosin heavy subunit